MTIHQRANDGRSHLVIDPVEALRVVKSNSALDKVFRIKVFRDYSGEFIAPFLKCYFARAGFKCDISFGGFDTVYQDVLQAEDLSAHDLILLSLSQSRYAAQPDPKERAREVAQITDALLNRTPAPIVLNTFVRPLAEDWGAFSSVQQGSHTSYVGTLNESLRAYVQGNAGRCFLIDWERLVMLLGSQAALDRRMEYVAALPFRQAFLSAYAYEVFRIGRALQGAAKKCLILDCDNTLWGGIVGEVGLEGLQLDPNSFPGAAYYEFQKVIVALSKRGVMVALCSKNNLGDVFEVLERHPHSVLKPEHLVTHRVNWEDKERNIQSIVNELNIGMDAVVFVDDSPVECARIEAFLPGITVRSVPQQLHELSTLVLREGFFDSVANSVEDSKRTRLYQEEAKRKEAAAAFRTVEEFLSSLEIKARIGVPSRTSVARVAQLTQKTNQFNLTTRRYTEGDILGMMQSQSKAVFALEASDKFGDLGLTGVLIAEISNGRAKVDTFLMSCRVLGRKLEFEFVNRCLEKLQKQWKPTNWEAEYILTPKNGQVVDFWKEIGFAVTHGDGNRTVYSAAVSDLSLAHLPYISVEMA